MKKASGKSKEIQAILKPYNVDIKRHISALSEDFQSKVVVIAEQYGDVKKEIGGVKKILDSHTEMIGKLMTDAEIIKNNVEFLKGGLKKKVDYDEFLALEKRMTVLESKIK